MKKFLSFVLCFSLLLSLCPVNYVSAANEKSWMQNFSGYDGTSLPEGFTMGDDEAGIAVYGTAGLFGKASDDTAFSLEVLKGATDNNLGYKEYPQWNMNTSLGNINFSQGDIFCWGYEMAIDSYQIRYDIRLDVQNQDNQRKSLNFISVPNNQNGKILCMGQTVANSVPLNTWVNLDFVLRTTTNKLDVYYNGNKVISSMDLTSSIGQSTLKMNFYRMFMVAVKVDNAYVNARNYIDNFYAKIVDQEPVISPVKAISNTSKVTVFEDLKQISADDSLTSKEFLDLISVPDNATVVLEDTNKHIQEGNLKEGYLRIETADGRYAYYAVSVYSPSKLKYNTFDDFYGKSAANNDTVEGLTVYTSRDIGAEGVSEDYDNVIKLYPDTSARKLDMSMAETGDAFAIAFDVKTNMLAGGNAGMTLKYEDASGSTSNFNDIIIFKDDGSIHFSYVNIGSYEANQWYHVTIFADKDTKKARVYIDGVLAVETTWSPLNSFKRVVDAILINKAPKNSDKIVYYDNLCIMPVNSIDSVDVSTMAIETQLKNENIIRLNNIYGYGKMTVAELEELFERPDGSSFLAYSEGKECDKNTLLSDGMLIKITAEDKRHKKVYYVKEDMVKSLSVMINDKQVDQLYEGAAKGKFSGYVQTDTDIYMLIEEIKNCEVVQSNGKSVTVSGNFEEYIDLEMPVKDEEGVSVRVSVYDNETDKNLLMPQKEIKYSHTLEYSTEIEGVYGGREAIYTITMDDGYATSNNVYFKPWFEKYDLRGSSLAICNWMTSPFVETAQQMVLDDRLDFMSHSYTHPGTQEALEANIYNEVYGSREYLRELFPGADVLSYGPGSGIMGDKVAAEVRKAYYANRAGERGYNNLDMTENDWYSVKVQGVLGGSGTSWKSSLNNYDGETVASMNKWLDNAVENNKWLVEMWHSVCWPESEGSTNYVSDGGYRPIPIDIAEGHLAYASKLQEDGVIWVAKMDDAIKYLYERSNAVLNDVATRTSRKITLTHELDKAMFNHPLTLKSEIPVDWNYVKITQGDIVTYKEALNDENGSYVIYDALVNYGEIVLESSNELKENEVCNSLKINVPKNLNQNVLEGESFDNVAFNVTGDVNLTKVVWYVDGQVAGEGANFTFVPQNDGESVICARYGLCYTQNRRVKTVTTIPPKGVQISNLKFKGAPVTVAENTQTFDANNALKFMWGDMTDENMSFQHGWVKNIKNIPESLKNAKFLTTGSDFNVDSSGNYLEFDVDRDVIIVGMYEGKAPLTTLASNGWTICSASQNSDLFNKYKYMRGDKDVYSTYMFYREFPKGKIEIPYAGAYGWAHGGGFAIVEKVKVYPLDVMTNGDGIMASVNSGEAIDWNTNKTENFEVGEKITLTSFSNDENKDFLFWQDENGKIISLSEEYSFTTGSGAKLNAVYADKSEGSFVVFKNMNGIVLTAGYVKSKIIVPSDPCVAGYSFVGWHKNGIIQNLKAGDTIADNEPDAEFDAAYKLNDIKYSVKLVNCKEEVGEAVYNTKITLTPSENVDGLFSYWKKDGKIVSYDESYSFYISGDTLVEAVFNSEQKDENLVIMSTPVIIDGNKIGFYAERNISENATVIESGILIHTENEVNLENYTYKRTTVNTENNGQFTLRKSNVKSGDTWYASAYVIYRFNNKIYTIYSNEVNYTVE